MQPLIRPDRFAEALSARRSELRAERRATESPRSALRAELALITVASRADLPVALRVLRDSAGPWLRAAPARLPARLGPALAALRTSLVAAATAQGEAAVRRVAGGVSGLDPIPAELVRPAGAHRVGSDGRVSEAGSRDPGAEASAEGVRTAVLGPGAFTVGPAPRSAAPDRAADLPALPRRVGWVEALVRSGGGGAVRVALVLAAGAPALGLTVAGGRVLLPLTVGLAVAAVVLLAAHRRRAVERERWARWVDGALEAAATALRAELDAASITLEQWAGPALDRLAGDRRAVLTHELRTLGGVDGG